MTEQQIKGIADIWIKLASAIVSEWAESLKCNDIEGATLRSEMCIKTAAVQAGLIALQQPPPKMQEGGVVPMGRKLITPCVTNAETVLTKKQLKAFENGCNVTIENITMGEGDRDNKTN